jgi:hypothetical protein
MSESQPQLYTIFCVIDDDQKMPFPVQVKASTTVGELKESIVKKRRNTLSHIDPADLVLYLINITDDENLAENIDKKFASYPRPKKLRQQTKNIGDLFGPTPQSETIHILVEIPETG